MASIYESPGQQVALTGSQTSPSFQPGVAYDPSRMMLRQSEQDLEAFSRFSESLTKFIVDKAKAKKEQELNLGIADILNGELTMKPEQLQTYRNNAQVLEQAADAEIAEADKLAQTNPGAAETYRQQSRALSGWRAYGQAVGKAQLAASQAESFLNGFLRNTEEPISIDNGDGTFKVFSPAEAESKPELMAAWSVGLQKFMTASGITNLNPAILVEYLTPTMLKVRAKLVGERTDEIIRNRQAAEREFIDINIGQGLESFKDPAQGQIFINEILKTAKQTFGGNWSEANKFVNQSVLSKIASKATKPSEAEALLNAYGELLINPLKPELGTFYNRYAEDFEKTRSLIKGAAREQAAEEEASVDEEINTIVNTWKATAETGNLRQSQQAFDAAEEELGKLAARYPKATEALSRIRQFGRNYNSLTEEQVGNAVANGSIKSRAELSLLATNGYISTETANKLAEQLPEDDSADMVKTLRPRMEAFIRKQLRGYYKSKGLDFEDFKDETLPLVGALADELMEAGLSKMLELKASGKTTGTAQLQSFLEKQAVDALKTERYKPTIKGNQVTLPTPGRNLPSVVPYNRGPNGRNYSQQIIDRLPPVVSAKRDILLDAEKVQANIDALNNGGEPSADLITIAKAAGLPVRTVLAQQAQKNGVTYSVTSADVAAKTYQNNFKIDPSAAQILANPRSTAIQRIRATARLSQAKQRQKAGNMPTNISKFRQAIIGKESGGNYSAVNPDSGALGIGQVMPENVGPWTQKYLGRKLTPTQFLNDPAAQDAVINGRFQDMIKDQQAAGFSGEQMIRRAAAVWYSGQGNLWNDTRPQYSKGRRYPSIAEYTQAIWNAYSK
jgi:hypothetical protein